MRTDRTGRLGAVLAPRSVAVVGAGHELHSVGGAVFANLLAGGYRGELWPVNPAHPRIAGRTAWPDVMALPGVPDLGIVCTPARLVPQVIGELGAAGTRVAVVLTAGLDQPGPDGHVLADAMCAAARAHGLRIVGPNCVGVRVPRVGLNASFTSMPALPGPLALVAQSGGVIAAFLAWAAPRGVGVSCCVSLGNALDVDAADLLDLLAEDTGTSAILLYLESARDGHRFIEAARRAAQVKPVFALKVGRGREGAAAAATHTGALAGADNVWEAALLEAGVRRVDTLQRLQGVAMLLSRLTPLPADRVAIVTNSGGPAVLAVDPLIAGSGALAPLSAATIAKLDLCLPATWSHRNPVDIVGDAPPARYAAALEYVTADPAVTTTLVMHVPTDLAGSADVQRVCGEFATRTGRRLVGCWLGDAGLITEHGIPAFTTPEDAVGAMLDVAAADQLRQRASARSAASAVLVDATSLDALRADLRAQRDAGQHLASADLVERLLAIYDIPFAASCRVATVDGLAGAAAALGFPVVLKIDSPDIGHKSDVGGVVTNIADAERLQHEAQRMLVRVAALQPAARAAGFVLQRNVQCAHARELIIGISRDAVFGPVVLFGHGGTAVHVYDDTAIGMVPLDAGRAAELVARTRVSRLLGAWRDWPQADLHALHDVLVRVASLALAVPEIRELDINPLLAHPGGVMALDARAGLAT